MFYLYHVLKLYYCIFSEKNVAPPISNLVPRLACYTLKLMYLGYSTIFDEYVCILAIGNTVPNIVDRVMYGK